jgi:23S rRNA pseudouridine2605 synthase
MTSHADPRGRPTIFQRLPKGLPRLISVGRLDFNTEGLILLTNDGALARILELPATGWLRRYRVRAHGSVTQAQLDELRAGVTIDSIHYREIEAVIDRVQGSNLWLTFAIREGKNREVRNVLGHLGLTVTRLIRVSFGPFQLGELAEGTVEEVPTRVLREQLGERVAALSGADFSAPVTPAPPPPPPAEREATPSNAWQKPTGPASADDKSTSHKSAIQTSTEHKSASQKATGRKSTSHSWRAREEERPAKKLRRKFRGSRRDEEKPREPSSGKARAGLLTDRKGRRVLVERFGQNKSPEPPKREAAKRGRHGRRVSPDRTSGARPRHPRER